MNPNRLTLPLLGALLASPVAHADDGQYPNVGLDYDATFQYDYTRADHSQPGGRETLDGYPDINSTFYFRFSRDSQIRFSTEINPIDPPNNGEKRFFEDVGMVINELDYYQQFDNQAFVVGKYHVPIGRAMDQAPGLYTSDFVDTYDMDGMLGGTYSYRFFSQSLGNIEPNLSLYTADNSYLGRPYFRHGEMLKKDAGGPANTGKLDSYAVMVNWLAIPAIPDLELQAGYARSREGDAVEGQGEPDDEVIRLASARYIWAFHGNTLGPTLDRQYMDLVPFIEYADVDNEDAIAGNDTKYLTTSLTFDWGLWAFGLTRTNKSYSLGDTPDDYLNEFSVVYNITGQLKLDVSAGTQKQQGENSNIVGLALTYSGGY